MVWGIEWIPCPSGMALIRQIDRQQRQLALTIIYKYIAARSKLTHTYIPHNIINGYQWTSYHWQIYSWRTTSCIPLPLEFHTSQVLEDIVHRQYKLFFHAGLVLSLQPSLANDPLIGGAVPLAIVLDWMPLMPCLSARGTFLQSIHKLRMEPEHRWHPWLCG